jgi:hypothetical protein
MRRDLSERIKRRSHSSPLGFLWRIAPLYIRGKVHLRLSWAITPFVLAQCKSIAKNLTFFEAVLEG